MAEARRVPPAGTAGRAASPGVLDVHPEGSCGLGEAAQLHSAGQELQAAEGRWQQDAAVLCPAAELPALCPELSPAMGSCCLSPAGSPHPAVPSARCRDLQLLGFLHWQL